MVLLRWLCPRRTGVSSARLVPLAVFLTAVLPVAVQAAPLQVTRVAAGANCVALTFDDGPDPNLTPQLLSILEQKRAPATFFVMGQHAARWPEIVARAHRDGFEIGNHSWDHPYLTQISADAARSELARTDDVIASITGERPKVTRPPYGKLTAEVAAAVGPRTFVNWSIDTRDWEIPDVDRIVATALAGVSDGAIILLHDIHPRSVEAVPAIIDGLRSRGLRLGTVSELMAGSCSDGGSGGGWGGWFATWQTPASAVMPTMVTTASAKPTAAVLAKPAASPVNPPDAPASSMNPRRPLFPLFGGLFGGAPRTP